MRASLLVIFGVGLAGCLALAASMRRLSEHRPPGRTPAVSGAMLAAEFGASLVGNVGLFTETEGDRTRLCVHARAAHGADRGALATAIGSRVWRLVAGRNGAPHEVVVTLRDADGADPRATPVPPPRPVP